MRPVLVSLGVKQPAMLDVATLKCCHNYDSGLMTTAIFKSATFQAIFRSDDLHLENFQKIWIQNVSSQVN